MTALDLSRSSLSIQKGMIKRVRRPMNDGVGEKKGGKERKTIKKASPRNVLEGGGREEGGAGII